jgi:BON domain
LRSPAKGHSGHPVWSTGMADRRFRRRAPPEVREEVLEQVLALDPAAVSVTVGDGVVRLSGQVPRRSLAAMTTRPVEAVEGVVAVESRLGWKVDDSPAQVPAPRFARYPDEWP